jgi:hypothetical protein
MNARHFRRLALVTCLAIDATMDVYSFAYTVHRPNCPRRPPRSRSFALFDVANNRRRSNVSNTLLRVETKPASEETKEQPIKVANEETRALADSLRGAVFQAGSDLFATLRWGAANALTSALPEQQRKDLLGRLDSKPLLNGKSSNKDDDEYEDYKTNSVGEAVAAAVAVESQKEKARWEREKDKIMVQAQKAAEERVVSELAIQQQRLEQEKQMVQKEALEELAKLLKEKKEQEEKAKQEKKEQEDWFKKELEEQERELKRELELQQQIMAWKSEATSNEVNDHPVLGPVVADLGYKRVHLVSASALATIPIWKKQRVYRHDRAKTMAADKLKTKHLGLPGVICLHEEENGKLSIVDGQHRVGMMKILQDTQDESRQKISSKNSTSDDIDLERVLVEVYPQRAEIRSNDHAQDIFMEINKAEPVKLVDMPGVATAKDRNLITSAVNRLEADYPDMFSPSQRCRVPHVNTDNLRDNVFAANVIKRKNMKNANDLYDWIISENILLAQKYADSQDLQQSVNEKAWNKAAKYEFYLGLESSWLYN